jgi:hypothetical protein
MKSSLFCTLVLLLVLPLSTAQAQTTANNADREAVRQAVLDYVEGIYNVEPARIERSVHPKLAKLGFYRAPADAAYRPGTTMAFEKLVEIAKTYNKEGKLPKDAPKEVVIYEVLDQTASAKLTAQWGIDYMHLAKFDGKWQIINVLWQSPPSKSGATQSAAQTATRLTAQDRQLVIKELEASRERFVKAVAGLSEAQLKFKSAPDRWSVAEVAEHITLTEDFLFGLVTNRVLKTPVTPDKERKIADNEVLTSMTDRSNKAQAPEPAKPTGKFSTLAATMQDFDKQRGRTIDFVKTTPIDLRSHFAQFGPNREIDGVQWLLVISGHGDRHVAQINEVKADPNFPKK